MSDSDWGSQDAHEADELAGPGARLAARLIDAVLLIVVFFAAVFAVVQFPGGLSGPGLVLAVGAVIVCFVAYEPVTIAVWGRTAGKHLVGIEVIADHGGPPGWGKSVGRWAVPSLLNLIPALGWLLSLLCYCALLWDPSRQGWHDKAAGTLVIKR